MIWAWFVSSTSKNYLNYSEIIELFKIKQGLTEVKIRQLMAGGARKRLTPHRRNKDNCAVIAQGRQVNLYFCILNKSDQTDQSKT